MRCPYCRNAESRVVDSRTADDGLAIRRRRQCLTCNRRFTTVEQASLVVVKRSGATEPFSRDKVITGVRKACQGRPVSDDDLAVLAHRVEEAVRAAGVAEVDAHDVGLEILGPLRELDEVAYMRFASVYRSFDSLDDFESEIALLRTEHDVRDVAEESEPTDAKAQPSGVSTAKSSEQDLTTPTRDTGTHTTAEGNQT
jgi:transcriptional repressor NrdR